MPFFPSLLLAYPGAYNHKPQSRFRSRSPKLCLNGFLKDASFGPPSNLHTCVSREEFYRTRQCVGWRFPPPSGFVLLACPRGILETCTKQFSDFRYFAIPAAFKAYFSLIYISTSFTSSRSFSLLFLHFFHKSLRIQLALVACYLPYGIVGTLFNYSTQSPSIFLILELLRSLAYFNSSLNQFLQCWKISEVKQAVKETVRGAFAV